MDGEGERNWHRLRPEVLHRERQPIDVERWQLFHVPAGKEPFRSDEPCPMSSRLHNALRGIASAANQGRAGTRLGVVNAYDPDRYAIKVKYPPDDVESGWIPLGALMVGNGYGILAPPAIGDQVKVEFQEGSVDAGIA